MPSRAAPSLVIAALVVAGTMAGCAQPATPEPEGPTFSPFWAEAALESQEGHDHEDALQHLNRTTPNFRVLGHSALHSDHYDAPPGSTFCGDAQVMPDGRRVAAAESRSQVGFTLVDVTDPMRPEWIGELVMEHTRVYDLAVVPDGRHVVLVTQAVQGLPVDLPPPQTPDTGPHPAQAPDAGGPPGQSPAAAPPSADPALSWHSPCLADPVRIPVPPAAPALVPGPGDAASSPGPGDAPSSAAPGPGDAPSHPVPRPSSILLVDIQDPSRPAIVDHQPLAGYGHSAFSTIIDGRVWVLATTTGPGTRLAAYETTSAFQFYEVRDSPAGARLDLLAVYKPQQELRNPGPPVEIGPRGHDSWIARHPGTGQTLAYLAAWERMEVLDLADPRQPRLVGEWTDRVPHLEGSAGEIHSVLPLADLRAERHFTVVGPEWKRRPLDQPSGTIWVLDTTDPAEPRAVAGWTLPHDVEWTGDYMFSNHYYGVHGDTLFVSMYHGGVWAVDLGPVMRGEPAGFTPLDSIGVFMPVDPLVQVAHRTRWAPTLEEVLTFPDGTLLTFDGHTGVWTFAFDAHHPAPPPEPWPLVAP